MGNYQNEQEVLLPIYGLFFCSIYSTVNTMIKCIMTQVVKIDILTLH